MAPRSVTVPELLEHILQARRSHPPDRALLIGLSGIDGAGKGWVAHRLSTALEHCGARIALLNVDGWLNLPAVRFNAADPARHFYTHALRLEDFRDLLLQPLRTTRSADVIADLAEETATVFRRHRYHFSDVDIVLAEGIYLFKPHIRHSFDLTVWIDCPFEVALIRALARGQEGLSPVATAEAYRTIYFPAQQHHFQLDHPRDTATFILANGAAVG
jgi:uridine kinase